MGSRRQRDTDIQREHYARTADDYDRMHVHEADEHFFSLCFMVGALDYLKIASVLDIGSGTGRALAYVKAKRSDVKIVGIEPVAELRRVAHSQGISENELIDGDATRLQFEDGQFDLVCAFGVLHHIRTPQHAIAEMLRVGRKAIFISDSNNFGQGSGPARTVKQLLNALRLWRVADLIKTKGKGYHYSDKDGLFYSYSLFNNYAQIRGRCRRVHLVNTKDGAANLYRTAGHVALLGIKE